ncbi:hypothetical protein N7495_007274 [Penicillium taxi]|uniref:uncharacterized protein n=1 Tax=Penicillium taxi TaxID=168475 RepID=UPI002545407B|nr:uncharacterized protein N7495_007274 [Penicillium taxi]KAJ5895583.1 hypothetical protein N7495_007274 [Penicillium taxi]
MVLATRVNFDFGILVWMINSRHYIPCAVDAFVEAYTGRLGGRSQRVVAWCCLVDDKIAWRMVLSPGSIMCVIRICLHQKILHIEVQRAKPDVFGLGDPESLVAVEVEDSGQSDH